MNQHILKPTEKAVVLIIDDSSESIELLSSALKNHYACRVARSGFDALKLLQNIKQMPDLILLDVMMPGMDGFEVAKHLKSNVKTSGIPIIFLSALTDVDDKVKAFENGGVDYIQKPYRFAEVQSRVSTHIELYALRKALENRNFQLSKVIDEKVKEISEAQMATIFALAKLAESRDDETGAHVTRVQKLCRLTAQKLKHRVKITDDFIDNLERATALHDIGKVGVSDSILLKRGKLTPDEFEEMKKHTLIGSETLQHVYDAYPGNNFIKIGIQIARSHHEKWDGSGYPDGLTGEKIPLSARIMAFADVYDALRSKRVYKEAFSHIISREIILSERSKHFDPDIVDIFLAYEDEFVNLYDHLVLNL